MNLTMFLWFIILPLVCHYSVVVIAQLSNTAHATNVPSASVTHPVISPVFLVFTPSNPHHYERLLWRNNRSRYFNASHPTKVIIHGFLDNPNSRDRWMFDMKDRFLTANNNNDDDHLNIVIVDWSKANGMPYAQACVNARIIGRMLADQLIVLLNGHRALLPSVHLIGHSLGAHVAGFAGKHLHGALGQITGLDPAAPLFADKPPKERLCKSDAHFVDVIHTDIGLFGMAQPCGVVDLYPNGGEHQPGCEPSAAKSLSDFILKGLFNEIRSLVSCNHFRAIQLYTQSISLKRPQRAIACESYAAFSANECRHTCANQNCVIFGPKIEKHYQTINRPMRFYIQTSETPPYFY